MSNLILIKSLNKGWQKFFVQNTKISVIVEKDRETGLVSIAEENNIVDSELGYKLMECILRKYPNRLFVFCLDDKLKAIYKKLGLNKKEEKDYSIYYNIKDYSLLMYRVVLDYNKLVYKYNNTHGKKEKLDKYIYKKF